MEKCIWELKCVWVRQRAALRLIKRAEGRECSEEKPSLGRDWGNDGKKDLVYPPSLHPLLPFPRYWAGVRLPAQCVYVHACPDGGFHSSRLLWLYLLHQGSNSHLLTDTVCTTETTTNRQFTHKIISSSAGETTLRMISH